MYFSLTKEQQLFRTSIKKYLASQEKTMIARLFMSGDTSRANSVWSGLAELGAMAINLPEEYGGADLTQVDLLPIFEEVGRVLLPGVYAETVAFATPVLLAYGTDTQKAQYLPQIAVGEKKCSIAIAEPYTNSFDEADIEMTAQKTADGYVLNGVKTFVIDGDAVDLLFVAAKLDEKVSLFIVDGEAVQWQTKRLQVIDETVGVTEVEFTQFLIPNTAIVAGGWEAVQYGVQHLQAALSAISVGAMEEVVEMSAEYAKTREQFGHPIGVFQAVKHRIVDMKVELDLARSLSYYANWSLAEQQALAASDVAVARAFTAEAFVEVAAHSIQMHGGIGYTTEIDCHLFLKRARLWESYLGSVQDLYETIIHEQGWRNYEQSVQQSKVLQPKITT